MHCLITLIKKRCLESVEDSGFKNKKMKNINFSDSCSFADLKKNHNFIGFREFLINDMVKFHTDLPKPLLNKEGKNTSKMVQMASRRH